MDKQKILSTADRWFPINPRALRHPEQKRLMKDFKKAKYRNLVVAAGRRSYKTERFAKRLLVNECMKEENKGKIYYAGAPTIMQAKEIFWDDLKNLAPEWSVSKIREVGMKIIFNGGAAIRVIGLKEFKRIQGQLMHGIVITEYQDCDPGVYNQSIEPMINDTRGWCIKEGRPFGKNHFFDDYLKGKHGIKNWQSYHWTSEDILSHEQINEAKTNLSKPDYEREYKASFETSSQRPYYAYTEKNNKKSAVIPSAPFIVACDFNAQEKPMSWAVGQRIKQPGADGNTEITYWYKSLTFQYTNTLTMCGLLDEDYFKKFLFGYPRKIIFYGDYAGKKYTSNSSYSDWEIIQNYFRNKSEIELRIKPCLSIRDSIAATNAQLCNANGERRQFVDPENCKELVKDWEYCSWKSNGRELEDKDPRRTHLSRAVDYYNDYEYPVKGKPASSSFRTT